MSARSVIEHALTVYYADSRDAKAVVRKLLAQYDTERERTAYRAEYADGGMPLGTYTNPAAARLHCETYLHRELPDAVARWLVDDEDEGADHELVTVINGEERYTGYVVTPLEVASAYDEEADE